MKTNNDISNARYYANAAEQQILIQGLQRYFSLPERSQNRNKITKEVSQFLQCFSPHWSHRAVRLWFNNNKHSYFNGQNVNTEAASNPPSCFPVISNLAQNNLRMKINNQSLEQLTQNSPNISLNNAPMAKIPLTQVLKQNQSASLLIQGMQYQNFNQTENRDSYNVHGQANALQPNFGPLTPMMQNMTLNSVSVKEQQQPASNHVQQSQHQTTKQQFVVPQILASSSHPPASNPAPPSAPITIQPSKPPLEVKIAPKIPQPQIQQNQNNSINQSSSLPPGHFQKIPTPQIDGSLYIEKSKKNDIKKKVTVMPPIKISSAPSTKSLGSSSSSSFSQSNSSSSFGQPLSFWGNSNSSLASSYEKGNSSSELCPTRERICKQITVLLKEIRETPEEPLNSSSLLKMKISEFESMCIEFRSHFGFLSPQIVDPTLKFTRFPAHDAVREMPGSLSSLSLSLLPSSTINDYNDGYGGDLNGFMYNDMGSLGNLSAFGRSDSNFSLSALSPSTSMNLINDTSTTASVFDAGRDESLSNFGIFGRNGNAESNEQPEESADSASKGRSLTYSSSPSFAPSTSSSIDTSMSATSGTISSSMNQSNEPNDSNISDLNMENSASSGGFIDQISHGNIWQARSFKSTHLPYFECTAMSRGFEVAAYTYKHIDFNSNKQQRAICFTSNKSKLEDGKDSADIMHDSWRTVIVDCHSVVESMVIDEDSAWLLTNREIIHSSFMPVSDEVTSENECCASSRFELPYCEGSCCLSLIGHSRDEDGYGVIACFSSSSDILFANSNNYQEMQTIKTHLSGISCVAALSFDAIACGVPLNGTITLLNKNGDEIRSFVGHCGTALGVYPLFASKQDFSTNLFASRADDNTIRVWDIRERIPLFQITTSLAMTSNSTSSALNSQLSIANAPNMGKSGSLNQQMMSYCSFLNVEGNDQYIMFGLNHQIGVIDIRKDFAKPILGVVTDDYDPVSLSYNQELNIVGMFGEVENIASKDSMLFVGNDGQSRKRIFRTYNSFVG